MGAPLGPVQVIPPGLTGFLSLKQTGRLPDELLGSYSPEIEMRDWLFQGRVEDELSLFGGPLTVLKNTASPGGSAFQVGGAGNVIPNGQLWFVFQFTVFGNLLAAETIRCSTCLLRPPAGAPIIVGPDYNDVITARARSFATAPAPAPFWARPGDVFGLWTEDDLTAATITVNAAIRAVRLPI